MIGINNFLSIPSLSIQKQSFSVETKQFDLSISNATSTSARFESDPLELAYQVMIDKINEEVAPYLGEGAIERAYDSGLDVSPEATANRIVSLSTALFPLYERQNPEFSSVSNKEALNSFIVVIRSGVEQGFTEAREILLGLGVLEGEIESNIDLTFDLVLDGFAQFQEKFPT